MGEYGGPIAQLPQRKPVPPPKAGHQKMMPLTPINTDAQRSAAAELPQRTHSRTRTSSSAVFPSPATSSHMSPALSATQPLYQNLMYHYNPSTRRTPSNATQSTSTTGTSGGRTPARNVSNASTNLRRSSSSRSGYSPSSYVSLMRKQKATVWCDRSQPEDPRIAAQQKAAKMRAALEVVGGGGRATTVGSGSVASGSLMAKSKIRHHGRPGVVEMTPKSLVGGVNSVPVRLSASEVGDDGNAHGSSGHAAGGASHRRNFSATSSSASHRWPPAQNPRQSRVGPPAMVSAPMDSPDSLESPPEVVVVDPGETPVPSNQNNGNSIKAEGDYFQPKNGNGGVSSSSGSSAERENSFGDVGQIRPRSSSPLAREKSVKSPDELRRRGSVDDRAMTMTGVRLFVANPDLSD
ncbi:MAG: hypothetical protein M1837_004510 [Sclerophora amabilis]|nr:MAG: hypothetical protein M1837_004510 [Sclerophora amabilis]